MILRGELTYIFISSQRALGKVGRRLDFALVLICVLIPLIVSTEILNKSFNARDPHVFNGAMDMINTPLVTTHIVRI